MIAVEEGQVLRGPQQAVEILVFSDDWGRHPSSAQHLVSRLLPRYPVTWCNTIGTRRPGWDLYSLKRSAEKVWGWMRTSGRAPALGQTAGIERPSVIAPVMWPSFRYRAGRRFNRWRLERAVSRLPVCAHKRIAVTTLPVVADLVGTTPVDRWVYYCVDDLSAWPGLDGRTLERMERELVAKVDEIVAASEPLVDRIAALGRKAHLLTHGVDLGHWAAARLREVPGFGPFERPLVVFWGVVDRRLDLLWIETLARRMPSGTVVLVGPWNDPDPLLRRIPRVELPGAVAYDDLPGLAAAANVLVMPYREMAATRAMQPLKLKEYLATGRPVVARALPAVDAWRDACDAVREAETFAQRVLERLATGVPEAQLSARARLAAETWEHKSRTFERLLLGGS
jgi:glycosyltransferase involved in cell wall biosynthesis